MPCPTCSRRRFLAAAGIALPASSLPSIGQPDGPPGVDWTRTFGTDAGFNDAASAHGGGTVLVGWIGEAKRFATRAWIVSVDGNGAVRWQRRLGPVGTTEFHSVVRTDRGYAVGGTEGSVGEPDGTGWFTLLDRDGAVRTEATYRDRYEVSATSVVAVDDGFVLAGSEPTAETANTWLAGFDMDLAERWSVEYRRTYSLNALLGTQDGPIVVGTRVGPTERSGMPWLAALDADGGERWTTTVDEGWFEDRRRSTVDPWFDIGDAVTTGDGGFVLAGRGIPARNTGRVDVIRLDAERSVTWTADFTAFQDGLLASVDRVDGGYLVTGNDDRDRLFAAALDEEGTIGWTHVYSESSPYGLSTTVDLDEEGRLLVGHLDERSADDRTRGWVATLSPEADATTLGEAVQREAWTPATPTVTTTATPKPTPTTSEPTITTDRSPPSTSDGNAPTATVTPGQPGLDGPAVVLAAAIGAGLSWWRRE